MSCVKEEFMNNLSDLQRIVDQSAEIYREYVSAYQKTLNSLFQLLDSSLSDEHKRNPYSEWMSDYFLLEKKFFGETPQNAMLGARLEVAIRHVLKSRFSNIVPCNFIESRKQTCYSLGRMEIALRNGPQKIFVQVKRGFDGKATWKRILQEKEAVEKAGNVYLLVSPTEYTNATVRKEIRENHLEQWCFIWKENCRREPVHEDWMERFLEVLGNSLK